MVVMQLHELHRRVLLACTRLSEAGVKPQPVYESVLFEFANKLNEIYPEAREEFISQFETEVEHVLTSA